MKAQSEVKAAKDKIEDRKNALKQEIENGTEGFRKSLAKLLGGGLTIVLSDDHKVLAIERPIDKEIQAFQKRVSAVKDSLKLDVLGEPRQSDSGQDGKDPGEG